MVALTYVPMFSKSLCTQKSSGKCLIGSPCLHFHLGGKKLYCSSDCFRGHITGKVFKLQRFSSFLVSSREARTNEAWTESLNLCTRIFLSIEIIVKKNHCSSQVLKQLVELLTVHFTHLTVLSTSMRLVDSCYNKVELNVHRFFQ